MFERYTESARRALFFARYELSQLGATAIETEHLLLGVTRETQGIVVRVLALAQLSPDDIRKEVIRRSVPRERLPTSVEAPFSAESRRVLQAAADEAEALLHGHIGPEHMLLGLLREQGSVAASILADHGLRLDEVRSTIVRLLGEPVGAMAPGSRIALADQIAQIKSLVRQLAETASDTGKADQLTERIVWHLDELQREFFG